jgi:hypothetical protein
MRRGPEPWTREERAVLDSLATEYAVQEFLDATPYSDDPIYRSPRSVLRDRKAHCVDGALFAAAALRRLGHSPVIMELKAVRDDDHFVTLFRRGRHVGAVAKSNCSGLRWREPIYRSLRELAMSYFEQYFNVVSERTLRSYSVPLDLSAFDRLGWTTDDAAVDAIVAKVDRLRHIPLISQEMIDALSPVDRRSYDAGFLGANDAGLWKPGKDV